MSSNRTYPEFIKNIDLNGVTGQDFSSVIYIK